MDRLDLMGDSDSDDSGTVTSNSQSSKSRDETSPYSKFRKHMKTDDAQVNTDPQKIIE